MRKTCKLICLTVALVSALGNLAVARSMTLEFPFGSKIEVDPIPEKVGPVELLLVFGAPPRHLWDCESIQVTIATAGEIVYNGPPSLAVQLTDTLSYRGILSVTVPPGGEAVPAVSSLRITIACGEVSFTHTATFLALGDRLKYIPGKLYQPAEMFFPELKPAPPEAPKRRSDRYWEHLGMTKKQAEDWEQLTSEQLRTIHKVVFDLRDPDRRRFAEGLLGPLPDSAGYPGIKGAYILDITLENMIKLEEYSIHVNSAWELPKRLRDSLKIRVPWDEPLW